MSTLKSQSSKVNHELKFLDGYKNEVTSQFSTGDWILVDKDNRSWSAPNAGDSYFYNPKTGAYIQRIASNQLGGVGNDGFIHNNMFRRGTSDEFNQLVLYYLNTGHIPESYAEAREIGFDFKKGKTSFENLADDLKSLQTYHALDKHSKEFSNGLFSGEGGINEQNYKDWLEQNKEIDDSNMAPEEKEEAKKNLSKNIAESNVSKVGPYNPYVNYMEQIQSETYQNELGLLQQQNLAQQQQAEIASQQMMMQNAQFKDQLLEQIKTERMAKLRSGMSQMQIANEEMQFMVGNQMQNQQAVSQANQQLLGAKQQEGMIPYQAWLNASQGVTGGQGYANFAAGMAATDASSLQMQAFQMMQQDPSLTYNKAIERLQTNTNISKN